MKKKGVIIYEWVINCMCIWDGHEDTKEKIGGVEREVKREG